MLYSVAARVGLLLALVSGAAQAEPEDVIAAKLKAVIPDAKISSIKETPFKGLYEVNSRNYESVLVSADGRYMIQGELLEITGNKIVNVREQRLMGVRKEALAAVKPADMVVFSPETKPKAVLYVFTDVDCGYCRKLHKDMPAINRLGIEVRYLAWPRSGEKGATAAEMADVWCAKDRKAAMTAAKSGVAPTAAPATDACRATVSAQYELGERLGVDGTPAIFMESGKQVGGYLPANELAKALGLR